MRGVAADSALASLLAYRPTQTASALDSILSLSLPITLLSLPVFVDADRLMLAAL
jgi:hypothetical protein